MLQQLLHDLIGGQHCSIVKSRWLKWPALKVDVAMTVQQTTQQVLEDIHVGQRSSIH